MDVLLAFYLIGSIIGRFSVEEHRHQREQELLVSGVEEQEVDSDSDLRLIG